MVENPFSVLPRGTFRPFFRSKSTCFKVLNFSNNILQINAVSNALQGRVGMVMARQQPHFVMLFPTIMTFRPCFAIRVADGHRGRPCTSAVVGMKGRHSDCEWHPNGHEGAGSLTITARALQGVNGRKALWGFQGKLTPKKCQLPATFAY